MVKEMKQNKSIFQVQVKFFEPFRAIKWLPIEQRKEDELKMFMRGLSFARLLRNGRPFIPGTLLRSALLKAVEELIAIENRFYCCPGKFVTADSLKKERDNDCLIPFLRRRPTYRFSKKDLCSAEDPCPFCLILGRHDPRYKKGKKNEYSVHFSNLDPLLDTEITNGHVKQIGRERIINRVDFVTNKAKDYFRIYEMDHGVYHTFSGKITFGENLKCHEEVEALVAAGLARVNKLSGALCQVDILENGSIQYHQDLIVRYFDSSAPVPISQQAEDLGNSYKETVSDPQELAVEDPSPSFPEKEKIKNLAEEIAKAVSDAGKNPHLRRLADAVRELRNYSPDKLDLLPAKSKGGSKTLWAISSKEEKSIPDVIKDFIKNEEIPNDSWRSFCAELGEAIYRKEKDTKKKAEAMPRLLGDTEYYGQPSLNDPGIQYADPALLPQWEWIIIGTLKAETPFYFGTESIFKQTSAAVLLTPDGHYRLPRSVLRGALRRELRDVAGTGCDVDLGGAIPCQCEVCRIMRRVTIMDSISKYQEPPEIRHRIRMNQHSGIVDEGALFDIELGPQGLTFPFRLHVHTLSTAKLDFHLWEALERWKSGMAFLGGDLGTGKGNFRLEGLDKVFSVNVKDPNQLKILLNHRGLLNSDFQEIKGTLNAIITKDGGRIVPISWKNARPKVFQGEVSLPWQKYKYEITLKSPILSNDPIAAMLDKDYPDTAPVIKRVLEDDGNGGFRKKSKLFIKGEGIRGIMRTAVGRNHVNENEIPLHSLPHDDCDCILCTLFGSEHHQGMLRFEDAHFENDPKPETLDHVAIDRFTGGARDKFKFDDSPLIATPDKPLTLKGTFWLKRDLHEASQKEENSVPGAARALWCAFLDVKNGLFPIGSNGGIGYGWVSGLSITDPDGNNIQLDQLNRIESSEKSTSANMEKEEYKPSNAFVDALRKEGHVFNPHYFLEPCKDSRSDRKTYIDRIHAPITHETYQKYKLTGKISCRLKTLGPLFVPDSTNDNAFNMATDEDIKSGIYHKSFNFFRLNHELMIPGSEIRGMISSIYEGMTNSCFRVLDEKRILSRRMEAKPEILGGYDPGRIDEDGNVVLMESFRLPLYDLKDVTEKINNTYKGNPLPDQDFATYASINRKYLEKLKDKGELQDVLNGKTKVKFKTKKINNIEKLAYLVEKSGTEGYLKITGPNNAKISKHSGNSLLGLDSSWKLEELNVLHNSIAERPGRRYDYYRPTLKCSDDLYDYNMDKRCERILTDAESPEGPFNIPLQVKADYLAILSEYEQNAKHIPKVFRTRFPLENNALKEGKLVYFKHENRIATHIIPVQISRKADGICMGKRFEDGFEDLRPCTFECLDNYDACPQRCDELKEFFNPHPKGLCPACRLFGTTSYKGRVSFGFARLGRNDGKAMWYRQGEAEEGKPLTLPLLERPRPTWSMPNKDAKIPGRKFYVHHPHSVDKIQGENPGPNNRTIEPLDKGNEFTFDIRFTNLEEYELGLFLYSLQLEKGMAHKLGMGKALGFGSVEIDVEKVEVRNGPGKWKDKTHNVSSWVDSGQEKLNKWFGTPWEKVEHIATMKKLLHFPSSEGIKPRVRYPSLSIKDEGSEDMPGYIELKEKTEEAIRIAGLKTPWSPWFPISDSNNTNEEAIEGTVKWFDDKKGFGRISCEDGREIFVHHSAIEGKGFKSLKEGQKVRFEVVDDPKGPKAANVNVIG